METLLAFRSENPTTTIQTVRLLRSGKEALVDLIIPPQYPGGKVYDFGLDGGLQFEQRADCNVRADPEVKVELWWKGEPCPWMQEEPF